MSRGITIHLRFKWLFPALAVMASVMIPALVYAADDDDAAKTSPTKPATVNEEKKQTEGKERGEEAAKETDEVKLTDDAVDRYGIRVGTAKKRKLESSLVVPARVQFNAEAMAIVGSAVEGRAADIKVRAGDLVKKGDELLVIESPALGEAQSDYLQKQAAVAAAEVAVEPAKSAFDRAKKLYDQSQGISLTDLQRRELDVKTAQSALLTAQAARDAAQNRLTLLGMSDDSIKHLSESKKIDPRYSIRAPITGKVVERAVNLGELVKPEREKLLVLADTSTFWVVADIPEARLKEVTPGAKAKITVASAGDQEFTGTVTNVAPSVDAATRSVRVRIEVKENPALKPGMFAQADISAHVEGDEEAVLAVPDSAIQTIDGSTAVFVPVKGEENTFTKRMVSIGNYAGGMVSIISGLKDGEHIVITGAFILKAELGKAGAKDED